MMLAVGRCEAYRLRRGNADLSYPSGYDNRLAAPIRGGTCLGRARSKRRRPVRGGVSGMGEASNPEGRSIPPGGTRGKPARKRPRFSVVGGTRLPRWGKGINKKAKRLAGPVRVRPLKGSEFDA